MQSESVQERWETLHDQQNCDSQNRKDAKDREQQQGTKVIVHAKSQVQHHPPQHLRQLWSEKE